MFAGRYLWWNMLATMAYVFFAIYFVYVSWLAIRLSGCASLASSCGVLEPKLNAVVRPYGMVACGVIVLASGIMRIRFLRMSPLWGLALFVWFGASAEFFLTFGNLWFAHIDMGTILAGMPIETLFLASLVIFMCFPVELYKTSPAGRVRVTYYVAGFTAACSVAVTLANSPYVLNYSRLVTRNEQLLADIAAMQARIRHLLSLGLEGSLSTVVVLAIFISALSYLVWIRKQPGGTPAAVAAA